MIFKHCVGKWKRLRVEESLESTFHTIFFERFEGIEDVSQFLSMCKYLSGFKFEIYQEVHSVHEVLLDWRLSVSNKTL